MKVGDTAHRLLPVKCLACGYEADAASCVGSDDRPAPGDATLCLNCGHLMIFDGSLRFREPSKAELVEFAGDKRIVAASNAIAALRARKETPHAR